MWPAHDPDWKLDGSCREVDPDLWFPIRERDAMPAVLICRGCSVKDECLAYGLAHREHGVWGGELLRFGDC